MDVYQMTEDEGSPGEEQDDLTMREHPRDMPKYEDCLAKSEAIPGGRTSARSVER